jgi:hypothetical protein
MPAAAKRRDGRKVLASRDLGQPSARPACRLRWRLRHERHRSCPSRRRLAGPQHPFGLGEIVDDLGDGAGLRVVSE